MENYLTEQQVFMICKDRVNYKSLNAKNHTICLDGTSCTKKSSILQATNGTINKTQRLHSNINSNTFFPSLIGYICSGLNNLNCGGPHFEDRSPLNVMDWSFVLWPIMDNYLRRFGNTDDVNKYGEYEFIIENYKSSYYYKIFADHVNTIAIIDSNVGRCDSLRNARANSSDCERSTWKFYTPLQNLMYKTLYPDTYIDLDWFGYTETEAVVDGIAMFLNFALNNLQNGVIADYAPLKCLKLPTTNADFLLANVSTHVYRSIGRWGCNCIIGDEEGLLIERIPSFINVSNIMHPMGNIGPDISSKDVGYLFERESPTIDSNYDPVCTFDF